MVTISFLLITAVWSHMSRLDATAAAPNAEAPTPVEPLTSKKTLEVDARDDRFVLTWKRGADVLDTFDVAVDRVAADKGRGRFPLLAAKVGELWRNGGEHRDPSDSAFDRAIVRVHDRMPYGDVVGVMDAVQSPKRKVTRAGPPPGGRGTSTEVPAFELVMGR